MYKDELRRFRAYMVKRVDSEDLRNLNLLGVQFALCECSKYWFYLRYESGPLAGVCLALSVSGSERPP